MPLKNKELLQMIMEAFSNSNTDFVFAHLADDISWNIVGMPVIKGKSEFLRAVETLELKNFSADNVKNIIAEGEFVVVENTGKAETKTEISNSPAYCDIYRFKNGKIHEVTTYAVDTSVYE